MEALQNKLPIQAKKVWRIYNILSALVVMLLFTGAVYLAIRFDWPLYIMLIAGFLVVGLAIFYIILVPKIRWDILSYEVREHEIELQSGLFIVTRTIIPIIRVQHVDVSQGPITKRMNLANIDITTAATTHTIPLLNVQEADALRLKISDLARVAKEDV